jgi:F-type H+-transporting ATPase subunit alpha
VAQMAVSLYASNEGFMDDVDVTRILPFETDLHHFMQQKYAAVMEKIASTKDLDKDAEAELKAACTEFKKSWS